MGVLTQIDGEALTNYCETWGRWRQAVDFLAKNGPTYTIKGEDGKAKCVVQFPQVSIARTLVLVLNRIQVEFGMTPSSRSKVAAQVNMMNEAIQVSAVTEWDKRNKELDRMIAGA